MVLSFLARYLLGDDIFISYSRADGGRYAAALANELTKRKFSCRIDTYDTQPGTAIPESLRKALRRSFLLVVVGTPGAAQSDNVTHEITEFRALHRSVVVLSFGGSHADAKWFPLVEGLYAQPQSMENLRGGRPSTESIDLIEDSFRFRRRNQRLAITFWVVASAVAALSGVGAYVGFNLRNTQAELETRTTTLATVDGQLKTTRGALEKGNIELSNLKRDLAASRADLEAQQALTAQQRELASARRAAADLLTRRNAVSYSSPQDVLDAIRAAETLAARGLEAEAYAVLSDHVAELPRLEVSFRHEGGVTDQMLTPDGQYLVTVGSDRTIRFWDYTNGREAGPALRTSTVLGIAFSQDGRYAVMLTTSLSVELWDVASRNRLHELNCGPPIGQIAISSKGNLVAVECRGLIVVFGRSGKEAFPPIKAQSSTSVFSRTTELGFTPDERHLVLISPRSSASSIEVYELGPMNTRVALNPACEQPTGVRPSFRLSADRGYVIREDRRPEAQPAIAIASVFVCRLPTLDVVGEFPHTSPVEFDLTKDGRFLATIERGTLRVWDTRDGALRFSHRTAAGTSGNRVMFSGDGRYVATSDFRVFGVPNGEIAGVMSGPADGGFIAIGSGPQLLAGSRATGNVHVWSFQTIHRTAGLHVPQPGELRASLSPGGRFLAATSGDTVERGEERRSLTVWDLSSGKAVLDRSSTLRQLRVAFLSDTEMAVLQSPTVDGRDVEIVALSSGTPSTRVRSGRRLVDIGFLSPYGLVGLDSGPEGTQVVEIRSGKAIKTWPRDNDDECEFVQGPHLVFCFGTTSGLRLLTLAASGRIPISGKTWAVAVTPERQIRVAAAEGRGFHVYEGQTTQTILRHAGPTSHVFFGDDARFVVAAGEGVVRIWSLESGAEILQAKLPSNANPVAVSRKYLVIRGPEQVQLWLWPFATLKNATCHLLARNRALPSWADAIPQAQYLAACAE